MAHSIFVGYLQNGTKKCGYKHRWYKFLRLQLRFLQKTEFITHLTAKTARGVAAHGVVVGYAVRW